MGYLVGLDRLRDFTARRALLFLGAFIVAAGFALALFSNIPNGTFGSFTSSPNFAPVGNVAIGDNNFSNSVNGGFSFVPQSSAGSGQAPGYTQVVGTTIASTTSSGGGPGQYQFNGTGGATAGTGSQLEFSSAITLQASDPESTASSVVALAYSVGGYVAYQSTQRNSAYVVIRVPASEYVQTLSKVGTMGTVVILTSNSNDVRVQYTDLNATLASLHTEQGALLRLLNQSTSINSTLAIESQLQAIDEQINQIESQILQTQTLISYSTIDATITESALSKPLSVSLRAAPLNGTAPFSVTFNAIVKGGTQPYFTNYNFGDGTADQGQILIHTYLQAGDFKVVVTVTDQNGNTTSTFARVHVDPPPGQIGVNNFFGTVANLFVSVLEGIVEVSVVVLPLAAVGAAVMYPLRRRGKAQKEIKSGQ